MIKLANVINSSITVMLTLSHVIHSWTSATLSRDFDILSGQFTDRWRQESPQKGVVLFQLLSSLEVAGESVAMIIKVSILGKMILLVTNQL